MKINVDTKILIDEVRSKPIFYALEALNRDCRKILGKSLDFTDSYGENQIRIIKKSLSHDESFVVSHDSGSKYILIEGNDDLGVVFGIYYFCENILGVDPYWFWTDFEFIRHENIEITPFKYLSTEPEIRFRGWFMNGEDLLIGWHDEMKISLETWKIIFETILRAGYNMTIPGTGTFPGDPQFQLASDMGLWISQHHAEIMGARMYEHVYPGQKPNYPEDLDKLKGLYSEAISLNKGRKVIWTLGLRGQGDCSFAYDDPRYKELEKLGKVISDVIKIQKEMIEKESAGENYFVHYLYAESVKLHNAGYLKLDNDIIKVWSDNGFGAMRMRRHNSAEENIPALPGKKDKINGVYYHVNFHDLKTSNQLVPLIDPELIEEQFQTLFASGKIAYLILNTGNIRPHIFNIDLIGRIANMPKTSSLSCVGISDIHCKDFSKKYFPKAWGRISNLISKYYKAPFKFGNHKDERAGEQTYHYLLRDGILALLNPSMTKDVLYYSYSFITDCESTMTSCFTWLRDKADDSLPAWQEIHKESEKISLTLSSSSKHYFDDSIKQHIDYMFYSCMGFVEGMEGLLAYQKTDFKKAFCYFYLSKKYMKKAWQTLKSSEHDKWTNFYRGDWLTSTQETIRRVDIIQGMCKILGDCMCYSEWTLDCLHLERVAHNILRQAKPDYDKLAAGLIEEMDLFNNCANDLNHFKILADLDSIKKEDSTKILL